MSAFLNPTPTATNGTLALISLGRENVPVVLDSPDEPEDRNEKRAPAITNTRFGSYPHTTLVNLPWGSQVLASNIGALERLRGKKRKREAAKELLEGRDSQIKRYDDDESPYGSIKVTFEAASSGFAHILPPTPENWTLSLPHRTQVVYTPDYSYILQRLCVRPGTRLIEAGAGSGSFTHAAVRAVFNGFPKETGCASNGKVFSYEYHEPRFHTLNEEIRSHGLNEIVTITHRDVYSDGFCLPAGEDSPNATAVFLDLPAPWLALPHLNRATSPSPLNPTAPIHICCFSPCIEQASRTAETLRSLGYVFVSLCTIQHQHHLIRRDRIGMHEQGSRGATVSPASVEESISRLRELEKQTAAFAVRRKEKMEEMLKKRAQAGQMNGQDLPDFPSDDEPPVKDGPGSNVERLQKVAKGDASRKKFLEGRVVHKTETTLRMHTSFLLFAILPREWTADDEVQCQENRAKNE